MGKLLKFRNKRWTGASSIAKRLASRGTARVRSAASANARRVPRTQRFVRSRR